MPFRIRQSTPSVRLSLGLALAVAYWVAGKLGLYLATINHHVSPLWPASGVAVTGMLLLGRACWPFVFVGAFATNLFLGSPLSSVAMIAAGTTLEALLSLYFFERFTWDREETEIPLIAGLTSSVFLGATFSAVVGSSALALHGVMPWSQWWTSVLTWWTGDAIGILLVVPFAIRARTRDYTSRDFRRAAEAALYLGLVSGVGYLTLWAKPTYTASLMALFPLLLVGVWRVGAVETGLSLLVLVGLSVTATLQGHGPFYGSDFNSNLVQLQLFVAALAITELVLRSLRRTRNLRSATVVILLGWLVTGLIFHSFNRKELEIDQAHFQSLVNDANIQLTKRVQLYETLLRSGAGYLKSVSDPNLRTWQDFATELRLSEFRGAFGLGFVQPVPERGLEQWARGMKKRFGAEFNFYELNYPGMLPNARPRPERYVIMAFEPREKARNPPGVDVSSEQLRTEAMERARDSRQVTMSDALEFFWLKEKAGFIAFMPVYRGNSFLGWVYLPMILPRFLGTIFTQDDPEIALDAEIDGEEELTRSLYPASFTRERVSPRHQLHTELQLWGKTLKMTWLRTDRFQSRKDTSAAWVHFIGVVFTLLLAALIAVFENLFQQAQRLADQKTRELVMRDRLWTSLSQVVPAAIFQLEPSGRLSFVNDRWIEYTGIDPARAPTAHWLEAADPGDRPALEEHWRELTGRRVSLMQAQCRLPASSKTVAISIQSVLDDFGQVSRLIGTLHDISEIHARQMQIMHSSRMATVGVMAAGMAHEINNPLTIIAGRAQLMMKQVDQAAGPAGLAPLRDSAVIIKDTVDRIARIIRGLRAFSRGGEGDPFQLASVPEIVQSTAEFCSERFKNHGVDLRIKPIPPIELGCREVQVSQVLLNLLNNGLDAAVQQPERWVELEVTETGDEVRFRVTDSGRGIPPEVAEKIMIPFFTTKPVGQGTGLGLSISKGIAQDHCGDLAVDARSPHTSFVFTVSKRLIDDGTVLAAL